MLQNIRSVPFLPTYSKYERSGLDGGATLSEHFLLASEMSQYKTVERTNVYRRIQISATDDATDLSLFGSESN